MSAEPGYFFRLHTYNAGPSGIATDGSLFWVSDDTADQVFVYDVAGTYLHAWALDPDNADASGITNDPAGGTDLWVVDREDLLVYHYDTATDLTADAVSADDSFPLSDGNESPEGIADPPVSDVDLTFGELDTRGLVYDGQSLMVSGQIAATIANDGAGDVTESFQVLFFEDLNADGAYGEATDNLLGSATVTEPFAAGQKRSITAQLSGSVLFVGNVIWGLVDSGGAIEELDEENNYARPDRTFVPPAGEFDPEVEWNKSTFAVLPSSNQVMMTPAVIDLNGDDIPDVVFSTFTGNNYNTNGVLRAISGADGTDLWSVTDSDYEVVGRGGVAVGDIDLDGLPEIIAEHESDVLMAFEHDGTFKWKSSAIWGGVGNVFGSVGNGSASIADMDGDGIPEVVVGATVLKSDGTIRWQGNTVGGQGRGDNGIGPLSAVADLDLDGSPEIVAGNSAYRFDGQLYWNASLGDGFPAIADFDADPNPEIVVVSQGSVYLLEHTGEVIWGPISIPGGGRGGPPTVADMDADGEPEIGVAGADRYVVFETDGSIKWQTETQDHSSNVTGSSVFDFDGDDRAEVVYADELALPISLAPTGILPSMKQRHGMIFSVLSGFPLVRSGTV